MKLLVFGGSGLVGSALCRVLGGLGHDVIAPPRAEYDILKSPPPPYVFAGVSAVINAAVVKPPASREIAWRVNSQFPHELAALCTNAGVKLIHLSTDGVFSGARGPYDESAVPDPNDDYGAQKLAGEPKTCLVLRNSVIGPERREFKSLLCWFLAQRGSVSGYLDQLWNGVTSLALARGINRLLETKTIPAGVRHLHADDVSKFELLKRVAKLLAHDVTVKPARAPLPRDRRLRTVYPEFLTACAFPTLDVQLAELPTVADATGAWKS